MYDMPCYYHNNCFKYPVCMYTKFTSLCVAPIEPPVCMYIKSTSLCVSSVKPLRMKDSIIHDDLCKCVHNEELTPHLCQYGMVCQDYTSCTIYPACIYTKSITLCLSSAESHCVKDSIRHYALVNCAQYVNTLVQYCNNLYTRHNCMSLYNLYDMIITEKQIGITYSPCRLTLEVTSHLVISGVCIDSLRSVCVTSHANRYRPITRTCSGNTMHLCTLRNCAAGFSYVTLTWIIIAILPQTHQVILVSMYSSDCQFYMVNNPWLSSATHDAMTCILMFC